MVKPQELWINGVDRTAEIVAFAESIGLERVAAGRVSNYFLTEFFCRSNISGEVDPFMVMDEIKYLEGCGRRTGTKEASQFTGKVLSGLWHKHHREIGIRSMAINLQQALREHGIPSLEAIVKEAEESGEDHYVTEDVVRQIAHDVAVGNYERRSDADKLTGEWIVFAKNEAKNYYLCLGKHNSGDDVIRQKIESVCIVEFPFLVDILKA
ncbi:hypothetical protein [Bordetella bronchiseptica]|uniref:hypothetical protein n=1 Tax=Bordetella bronchiseptica TaxID=518 RepID=UPI000FD954C8|nr:hypothetical protein [Bordetella bronchiseptica]